jgi:hypothetical protein
MTEIFWLKTWFAVAMIGLVLTVWEEWKETHYEHNDIASRVTRTLVAAGAGFFTFGVVSAFLFLIVYGLVWFFTA